MLLKECISAVDLQEYERYLTLPTIPLCSNRLDVFPSTQGLPYFEFHFLSSLGEGTFSLPVFFPCHIWVVRFTMYNGMLEKQVPSLSSTLGRVNWWKARVAEFPQLAPVAVAYLLTPKSSAQAERTFSLLGHVQTDDRLNMAKHLQQPSGINNNHHHHRQ